MFSSDNTSALVRRPQPCSHSTAFLRRRSLSPDPAFLTDGGLHTGVRFARTPARGGIAAVAPATWLQFSQWRCRCVVAVLWTPRCSSIRIGLGGIVGRVAQPVG